MIVRAFLAVLLIWTIPVQADERVVTGISKDNIALNASFNGSSLFVFGAVSRDAPIPIDAPKLDVVITIKGPEGPAVVRRKERWFGIWVNRVSVTVRDAPSYYAIASTRNLSDIITQTEMLRYKIGMDQAVRKVESHQKLYDTQPFAEAVVRIRMDNRLYSQRDWEVYLAEETLFQSEFEMPSNIVEGEYTAEFFLIRDKEVVSTGSTEIIVQKTGIERWLYNLAQNQPLIYGCLSVFIALVAGWVAATAFSLAKR